ncbi:hypothetical protein [Dactylosporangium sp. NPDC000521]|uniref:hypothetical protein n=1 Tax=Dactylosporangium sp. NPDC000521 TaxID=3363975 RepID=UPI0036ABA076
MAVLERQGHLVRWWPAAALLAATAAQGPAGGFVYDAAHYFDGSLALFTAADTVRVGDLDFRGALTPLVYAPAALAEHLVTGAGRYAVLLENALLVALVGGFLLPRIAARPAAVWVCAPLTWLVAARFAPFPLMDLPAVAAFLTAVWLALRPNPLRSNPLRPDAPRADALRPDPLRPDAPRADALRAGTAWCLGLAGVAAGVTVNLRPAYLLPLAALGGVVVVTRRWPALWFAAGVVAGSLPQVAFNALRGSAPGLTPPGTADLAGFQAGYASYVVRYDTIEPAAGAPQQFYCDPSMAAAVDGRLAASTGGLVRALLTNLPESALFLAEKVAAALAWSWSTPYSAAATAEHYELTVPVVLIVAAGIVAACRTPGARTLAVLAAGVCASLMTSATETRFALPLVLLAVAGCALLTGPAGGSGGTRPRPVRFAVVVLVAAAAVSAVAALGVAHPLPPGPATPAVCAANG